MQLSRLETRCGGDHGCQRAHRRPRMSQPRAMRILVTGATGLIGRHLCRSLLDDGHAVIGLSRSPENARGLPVTEMRRWDAMNGPPEAEVLAGTDAVIHLAGEPIAARRWSDEQK